jgi:adenosine deaminase
MHDLIASGLSLGELKKLSLNAIKSAFAPFDKRIQIIFQTIKSSLAVARAAMP